MQIGDAGNRRDNTERPVPAAGIAHSIVMRAEHQTRTANSRALVTPTDIADRIEMRSHAGFAHPRHQDFGGGAMLRREKDSRDRIRSLRDRG